MERRKIKMEVGATEASTSLGTRGVGTRAYIEEVVKHLYK
jgi:hypothetical protein